MFPPFEKGNRHRFPPGKSGNPGGRVKLANVLAELGCTPKKLSALAWKQVIAVLERGPSDSSWEFATRLAIEHTNGKPVQAVEVALDDHRSVVNWDAVPMEERRALGDAAARVIALATEPDGSDTEH